MTKSLRELHDVELAVQAAAGGRREYGELVRRHGSAVRGLLRRMGAAPSLADDVAQDAFLQGFQRCAEFRGQGTFAGWIKKIAARLYLKRAAHEARYVAESEVDEAATPVDHAGALDLDEAMKALNETERVCVSLCHGAGMSHPEIAAAMNLPLGTVKSHVKRGLDKLRARLQPATDAGGRSSHVG
ncbi:MAG: RNA polymerase subunit sigma-70 [Brevundimonas sp.]|uniref:RNA polymerase sigma factor n=1 Tax=Brevundimonas sp. TaxID=1871086 RepID=UPI000DB69B89|nr:sigma-70 family RNA polymerase sigma factor [Brevundimonas sp.]PZU72954.1 MAG: RNA polymerase subunit sigma-70 [Brevundimonas sp.]